MLHHKSVSIFRMRSKNFMLTNACVKMFYCPFHITKKHFQILYQNRDKVIKEKYRFFNAIISSTFLALHRSSKVFETLFSVTVMCSFSVRRSSINTPKYLNEVIHFISISFINNNRPYLVPSCQYERVLLCFCVKRQELYHLQILWSQIF